MKSKKRLHFGAIFSTLNHTCQHDIWSGIIKYARKHDIHLTAYCGTYQEGTFQEANYDFASHYDTCFETIKNSSSLDGIIIFSGFIVQNIGSEKLMKYVAELPKHIPLVSVSLALPGVPSVLVDNISGIYDAVEHLIQVHDKKQIAFIKGPDGHHEAGDRLDGYKRALEANGIEYDERYVFPGNFRRDSGHLAVEKLLGTPNLTADAIVASNDETAIGALNELKKHNLLAPINVAVTGFDDDKAAATFIPSISTARQDFFEIGMTSAQLLLNQIHGSSVKEITYITPVFIARQSCGCLEAEFTNTEPRYENDQINSHSLFMYVLQEFTALFQEDVPKTQIHEWAVSLVEALKERPFSEENFLRMLNEKLISYNHYSKDFFLWSDALNILTMGVECHSDEVEGVHTILSTLIFATTLVHDIRFKEGKVREYAILDNRLALSRVASNLVLMFDSESLSDELHKSLPELSISTAIVGLYRSPKNDSDPSAAKTIETIIGFDGDRQFNIRNNSWNSILFSDYSNIDNFDFESERRDLFITPLFFKDEELGVILMSFDPEIAVDTYETLRVNISLAVKGEDLLSQIQTLSITDELTGLLNRRGFFQHVYSRLPHLSRNSDIIPIIMFMDMDNLKHINDTYGHAEGDVAISVLAKILKQILREEDIVGRLGGDEFVVFSSVKANENVDLVVKRIRDALDEYNSKKLHPYSVMASIGSVILESTTKECLEAAVLSADSVLYEEKIEKKKKGISRR